MPWRSGALLLAPSRSRGPHVEILAVEIDTLLAGACGPRGRSATAWPRGCLHRSRRGSLPVGATLGWVLLSQEFLFTAYLLRLEPR